MNINAILKQSQDIHQRLEMSDGYVIHQSDKIHTLNTTASEILNLFDGTKKVQDVINEIDGCYPGGNVSTIVGDFIRQMYEAGLLIE